MMEKIRKALNDCVYCCFENMQAWNEPCSSCGDQYKGIKLNQNIEAELKEAEEAMENQVAKKVIIGENDDQYDKCPVCGENAEDFFIKYNYCQSCGQKLDWSV